MLATDEGMTAKDLIASNLVWDNHGCMPLRPFDEAFLPKLELYRASGVDVAMLNIGFGEQGIEEHVRMLAHFRRWIRAHNDRYLLIETIDDLSLARATNRLAIGFDMEGANGIADQPGLISLYYDLGVRWMLMAYNGSNRIGGGCQDDEDLGLTAYGREVLDEMARVGMVACCSHTGYRTARDVLEYSRKPVIFSHSNPRALFDHPRNIPDELILGCARTSGVVCLNGIGNFLGNNDTSTENYFRHVDHVVQQAGAEHVGIGLDYVFDTAELDDYLVKMKDMFPPELGYDLDGGFKCVSPAQIESLVELQIKAGYSQEDIRNILGGNLLRVAQAIWNPGLS
ncbi:dipeptidase [Sphingobium sp.]|uniref:dipeptidase n=1 Tax=Sphingobium sp. TaxID=1912891 RepID=UPI002B73DFAE|nr:membrane dipeptidase [Sphingobium sp.]HUD93647.1 membrane dipeptidase [Sphingobium sp.]